MAAGSIERVQVIIQGFTKGFHNALDRANSRLNSVGKNINHFGQVMRTPMENFKVMNGRMAVMKTTGGRLAYGIRNWTHGMRGFRMEMLGVMFFGMMLQRMFLGLLQPVMEAFGVFDLFRLMLLVLFLPVMEQLFPVLLKIMEWFMDLPEPVKQLIGWFTIIGAILGTLIMVFGSFALGIGSLILAIPVVISILGTLGAVIGALGAPILIIIAIIAVLVFALTAAGFDWKRVLKGMLAVATTVFTAIWQVVDFFIGLVYGIINFIGQFILGFIEGIVGHKVTWEQVWDAVWRAVQGAWKFLKPIIQKIGDAVKWVMDLIGPAMELLGDFAREAGKVIGGGVRSAYNFLTGSKDDFIWRPGEGAISINPNDTLVGFKGQPPFTGGGGEANITNNFYGFTMDDLRRELDDRDRRVVEDIRRLVKT